MSDLHRPAIMGAWHSLIMARRRVLDAVSADLKTAGHPQLDVCLVLIVLSLDKSGGLRPVEIERRLEMAQYTTSRLLDRMERSGLIERQPTPVDGRGHIIGLTDAGREALKAIWPVYVDSIERHLGGNLSDDGAGELARLLELIGKPAPAAP